MARFYSGYDMPPAETTAAAGTTQATAAELVRGCMTAVPAASVNGTAGVVLPAAPVGAVVRVYNGHAANGLLIYPQVGGTINGGAANAAVTLSAKKMAMFESIDGTGWAAIYS